LNNNPQLALIIPAAGSGQRLGTDIPKPYIAIAGKTILEHTLLKFRSVKGLVEVVVSTSADRLRVTDDLLKKNFPDLQTAVVEGGSERQHSIMNAMNALRKDAELIAVHDAVRPFVETEVIERCVMLAAEKGAAIVAVPAKDTVKIADADRKILSTPSRSNLWQAQTPQIFRGGLLRKAYENALNANFLGTDDASLVEALGQEVFITEGSRENFKITYPLDMKLAEWMLLKETGKE
jgi:2-C-methyl-D-erythritol 4-phosphate cytidylyltransferase